MDEFLSLVSPVAARSARPEATPSDHAAPRSLRGARLGLVSNGKANAFDVLQELQTLLQDRCGVVPGVTVHKPVNGPVDQAGLDALEEHADIVLVASAD